MEEAVRWAESIVGSSFACGTLARDVPIVWSCMRCWLLCSTMLCRAHADRQVYLMELIIRLSALLLQQEHGICCCNANGGQRATRMGAFVRCTATPAVADRRPLSPQKAAMDIT